MAKQEEVARADADIAQSNKRADWSVELMYSQRGPAYSNMVSVNVSVPLQWDQKNRQDRELSAKLAIAEQMRAQREEATREHVADTRMWLQEWQSNRERLAQYDSALIPLAAERTRAAIAAYRGGSGPLTAGAGSTAHGHRHPDGSPASGDGNRRSVGATGVPDSCRAPNDYGATPALTPHNNSNGEIT
jgi:hypothetical protein